jgi:hypothetical protein
MAIRDDVALFQAIKSRLVKKYQTETKAVQVAKKWKHSNQTNISEAITADNVLIFLMQQV